MMTTFGFESAYTPFKKINASINLDIKFIFYKLEEQKSSETRNNSG